ncbi:retrovirus-related pol polyprotein from transposon TNT 1-94 [Tanacetum coccineum]
MTTPTNNSQMHNNIMAVGSKDHPPMLATWRYAQWELRFLRYVDTEYNKKELKQCIFDGLYVMIKVFVLAKPATTTQEAVHEHNVPKTYGNTTPKNQGESLNKQDVKTNLFWEFGKFISRDGESIESYYSRTVTIVGARETIGNQVVQKTMIQCFNCKEYGHFPKECRKPKWEKDYEYHKGKIMLCKQESKGVPLSAEQNEWRHDIDDEPDEQELEAHYMYKSNDDYNVFATERQYSEQPQSINDIYVVETVDSNVIPNSSDMCDNEEEDDQYVDDHEDERVALANLTTNLKLDIDENKTTQNQLRKANATLTHFHFDVNHLRYVQINH